MTSYASADITVTSWGPIDEDGIRCWRVRSLDRIAEFDAMWDAPVAELFRLGRAAIIERGTGEG